MKIGIITNLYPPHARGGAEQVIARTVQSLLEYGHDVFLITTAPRSKGSGIRRGTSSLERVYRFFPKNIYYILDDFRYPKFIRVFWHLIDMFSPHAALQCHEILEREQPDIVMTHNLKGIGLMIPLLLRLMHLPHAHVVHDLQLIYPSGLLIFGRERIAWWLTPFYALYARVCRCLFGNPGLVFFPSTYLATVYQRWKFFQKSERIVLPNPAPNFPMVNRQPPEKNTVRLLFVGQLEWHKGIKFLIEALREMPDIELVIAGEGTLSSWVLKQCEKEKRLTYLGFICADHLQSCLGTVDAVVVPSLCYENSPTVIYESLSAGIPVIASDIGGVGELVKEGKNGFLFSPGSEQAFAHAIWKLRQYRVALMANQQQIAQTIAPFALSAYTKELLRRLEMLIAQKRKS
ncbi:MAG: glycosyltransferase [Patescibacteria group bacterium]|jgi:glycosyltransferase involved in cell wall biosynthesis